MTFSALKEAMSKEKGYTWHTPIAHKSKNEYAIECFKNGNFEFVEVFEAGDEIWWYEWCGGPLAVSSGAYLVRNDEVIGYQDGDLKS